MYSEIQKAGVKQFFFSLAAASVLWFVTLLVRFFTQGTPIIGHITTILVFMALVYAAYVHYAPVFEYKLDGHTLTVTRRTGHREKVVSVTTSQIKSVSKKTPKNIKTDRMCVAVFFPKNPLCINYGSRAVLIDGSDELYSSLKNAMNGDKKWQK